MAHPTTMLRGKHADRSAKRAAATADGRLRRPTSTGVALLQFALSGVAALVVLAVVGLLALHRIGTAEAVRQARELATVETEAVVRPAMSNALAHRDPQAVARFGRLVDVLHRDPRVFRIKLWQADGTIVYADDKRLIGKRFPLEDDDLAVLRTGVPEAGVTNLDREENVLERKSRRLLQVYERVQAPNGEPLLFEVYLTLNSVVADSHRIGRSIAPAFLTALLALEMLQLPLAWRLARRLWRGQRERDRLHTLAVDASDDERRRIARDLHDTVVQDLAGMSYSLFAVQDKLARTADEETQRTVAAASATSRRSAATLRNLIVDIYPPNLDPESIRSALADLVLPLEAGGVDTVFDVPLRPALPPVVARMMYRTAQEAIRNVQRHASARVVTVRLTVDDEVAVLEVADDGVGFDNREPEDDRPRLGLRLLADLATTAGGALTLASAPGEGTSVRLEVPIR